MLDKIKKLLGMGPSVDIGDLLRNGAKIIDVRSKDEYAGGHIKTSVNIPLDKIGNGPLPNIKDMDTPIVTCCASGMRSAAAKSILKKTGYTNVHNGGSWQSVRNKMDH